MFGKSSTRYSVIRYSDIRQINELLLSYENIIALLRNRTDKNYIIEFYLEKYFSLFKKANHKVTEEDLAAHNERMLRSLKN